jgi:hypothetical protein
VCNWEDDNVQFTDPDFPGGANRESLRECQRKWLASTTPNRAGLEVRGLRYQRSPDWRPLGPSKGTGQDRGESRATPGPGVRFAYELIGRGWAQGEISIGDQSCVISASYLSDALADLSSAICALLRGHPEPTAQFVDEPGTLRWVFSTIGPGRVRVQIVHFPESFDRRASSAGTMMLDANCDVRVLAEAVLLELTRLYQSIGSTTYADVWGHPFPFDRLRELQHLVGGGAAFRRT